VGTVVQKVTHTRTVNSHSDDAGKKKTCKNYNKIVFDMGRNVLIIFTLLRKEKYSEFYSTPCQEYRRQTM